MAKPEQLLPLHTAPELSVIVSCGCGCGPINKTEHAYIYSKVTGLYYADMYCMSVAEEREIDLLDKEQRVDFLNEMEAVSNG